ncbi:hypothetical protein ACP70R_007799 [Stipagrostis hirtigluma subsp. patula]
MLRRAAAMGSGGYAVGPCTESLGSESGDVGGDAEIDRQLCGAVTGAGGAGEEEAQAVGVEAQQQGSSPEEEKRRRRRRLPPAMPRAAEALFMRAERRGGRLILTEVRFEQPRREVFRASRAGGRLRLRFADDDAAAPDGEPGKEAAAVASGCCGGAGAGELSCQVAAGGAAGRRVEIGAVIGI